MSDTPETDKKASPHIGFFSCATVPAEFARSLERERDEAQYKLENARQSLEVALEDLDEAKRERDEARNAWEQLKKEKP
jgi:uncharacterized protein (DUF3084 family)